MIDKIRKMGMKQLSIGGSIFLLLMVSSVFAAWQFFIVDDNVAYVGSEDSIPITLYTEMLDININTSKSAVTNSTNMVLYNSNGPVEMKTTISLFKDVVNPECNNIDNDCVITITNYNGTIINDQDTTLIPSGYSNITATYECVQLSCPQTIGMSIMLEKL